MAETCLRYIILDTGQTFGLPQPFYLPEETMWRCLLGIWVGHHDTLSAVEVKEERMNAFLLSDSAL